MHVSVCFEKLPHHLYTQTKRVLRLILSHSVGQPWAVARHHRTDNETVASNSSVNRFGIAPKTNTNWREWRWESERKIKVIRWNCLCVCLLLLRSLSLLIVRLVSWRRVQCACFSIDSAEFNMLNYWFGLCVLLRSPVYCVYKHFLHSSSSDFFFLN